MGVAAVDMPSNWTALHWGLSRKNSDFIIAKAKQKTETIAEKIFTGRKHFKGFVPLIFGLLLLPISLVYMLLGRFGLAKLFYPSYRCNGCGICASTCPNRAIRMLGNKKPRPYWTYSCESCMRCMAYCPEKAVEASHPLAYVLYLVGGLPIPIYIMSKVQDALPGVVGIIVSYLSGAFGYAYILLSYFAVYLLFTLLVRIPLVNRLLTYLTLTHYYRRYHEPDTKLSDLK